MFMLQCLMKKAEVTKFLLYEHNCVSMWARAGREQTHTLRTDTKMG